MKGSTQSPNSFAKAITINLRPSRRARWLLGLFYAGGFTAILAAHLPAALKLALCTTALLHILAAGRARQKRLHIKQLRLEDCGKISVRDAEGQTHAVKKLRFERIICYYLAMSIQIDKSRQRMHILADMTNADDFRKLRAFAVAHRRTAATDAASLRTQTGGRRRA